MQQYLLKAEQLKSSFAEEVLAVLLVNKFHMVQQCAFVINMPNNLLGCIRKRVDRRLMY